MCGRFVFLSDQDREQIFNQLNRDVSGLSGKEFLNPQRSDIYPSQDVPVILSQSDKNTLLPLTWGYENPFKKGLIINARSEGADQKPMFRQDLAERRCLIPATGFYEWDPDKNQYRFLPENDPYLYLAGLWRPDPNTDHGRFVILTKEPNEIVSPIHKRMPVIIPRDSAGDWLSTKNPKSLFEMNAPVLHAEPVHQQLRFF